ncbi:MAG: DUF695 domain-containing protein [Planctomycetota bacterium]|jgi:hypothetical protein
MPATWQTYPCQLPDDGLASIVLNLQFGPVAPVETLPVLLHVRVGFHGETTPLPTPPVPEQEALMHLEGALRNALAEQAGAIYVGRVTLCEHRNFAFYAPADSELAEVVAGVQRELGPEHMLEAYQEDDPEWKYYKEFLSPTPSQWLWINNRDLVRTFEQKGDALSVPRPVEHFAYFPGQAARDQFAQEATERGFVINLLEPEREADPLGAKATRDDPIDLNSIQLVSRSLQTLVEEVGGEYDGWGAPLITDTAEA